MNCFTCLTPLNIFMLGAVFCWTQGQESCLHTFLDMNPETCCNCTSQPVSLHCYASCPKGTYESVIPMTSCEGLQKTQATATTTIAGTKTTAVPVVTCLPCYFTCSSCNGGGEDNCTACAPGYQKSQTTSGHLRCALSETGEPTDGLILIVVIVVVSIAVLGILLVCCFHFIKSYVGDDTFCSDCCCTKNCRIMCSEKPLHGSHRNVSGVPRKPTPVYRAPAPIAGAKRARVYNVEVPPATAPVPQGSSDTSSTNIPFSGSTIAQVHDDWAHDNWILKTEQMSSILGTLRKEAASIAETGRQNPESCSAVRVLADGDDIAGERKEVCFSSDDIERFSANNCHNNQHLSSSTMSSNPCYVDSPKTGIREEGISGVLRLLHEETKNGSVANQPRSFTHRSSGCFEVGETSDIDDEFFSVSLNDGSYPGSTDPERDNSSPDSEALDEIKAERTSNYILMNRQNSATKRVHPIFCPSWQFSRKFSCSGGVLQGPKSAVRLEVPKGTLKKDTELMIEGAISVDLETVHKKVRLPQFEYIASPVAEYISENRCMFQKPVWIILPHFLPPGVTAGRVCVYCARRDQNGQLHIEKMQAKAEDSNTEIGITKSGSFFFDENNNIRILTHHFSAYFCTDCGTQNVIPDLWVQLYAKHTKKKKNERRVDVRLEVWDRRVHTRDFTENHPDAGNLSFLGMQRVDGMELPALRGNFDLTKIDIVTRLMLTTEQEQVWMHRLHPDGNSLMYPVRTRLPLTSVQPCNCRSSMPKRTNWQLTSRQGCVPNGPLEGVVDVGYAETDTDSPFSFLSNPERITFDLFIELSVSSQQIPGVDGTDRLTDFVDVTESKHSQSDSDSAVGSARSENLTIEPSASLSTEVGAVGGRGPIVQVTNNHITFIQANKTTNTSTAIVRKTEKMNFDMTGNGGSQNESNEQQARQGLEGDQHRNHSDNTLELHDTAEMNLYSDHQENSRLPPQHNYLNGHVDDPAHISHRDPDMHHSPEQGVQLGVRPPHQQAQCGTGRSQERPRSNSLRRLPIHAEDGAVVAESNTASRLPGPGDPDTSLPYPSPVTPGSQEHGKIV